jgi:antitoxin ParD1/3/4
MNVSLTPQLKALVQSKVKSGMFGSASEVIRHSLRLFKQEEEARMKKLREDVLEGFAQVERGEYIEVDENSRKQFLDDIKARGRKRLAAERKRRAS